MFISPGARIPRSWTAEIIEFLLRPRWNLPPMSRRMGNTGSVPGVPQIVHAHGQPAAISLPGHRPVLSAKQTEAVPNKAIRSPAHLLFSSPSHHGEEVITSAKPTPGGAIPRGPGTCGLPSPQWVSPCSLERRRWLQ